LAIHLQQNIGSKQNKNWETPTYLFYTVKKKFHHSYQKDHEPQIELCDKVEVQLISPPEDSRNGPPSFTSRCLPNCEPNQDSNLSLSSDTEEDRRGFDWYFIDPIGSRGYKFQKRFHAGWYEGEVVLIDNKTGE
jgi:hypothetical protein